MCNFVCPNKAEAEMMHVTYASTAIHLLKIDFGDAKLILNNDITETKMKKILSNDILTEDQLPHFIGKSKAKAGKPYPKVELLELDQFYGHYNLDIVGFFTQL